MATDYGTGIGSLSSGVALDMDPYWRRISGARVVLYAVARRFVTPRGSLWWAPDDGYDIRELVGRSVRDSDLPMYERLIAMEAERDERVLSADVVLAFSNDTLRVDVTLKLAEGTFRLVMEVSKTSAAILLAA